MNFKIIFRISLFLSAVAFEDQVDLPDDAEREIDTCKQKAKQGLAPDMYWQGHLACLKEYYTNLPANNLTDDDWTIFKEAERTRLGFHRPPSGFRTRREVRTLSDKEWNDVAQVFVEMYKQGTLRKFGRLHGTAVNSAHRGAGFLVWHRVFLTHFEEEMRKINPAVSLPYWDYTIDNNITKPTDSVLWTPCFFGNNVDVVSTGKVANFYNQHGAFVSRDAGQSGRLINKDDIENVLQFCHYKDITTGTKQRTSRHNLERLHDGVHNWVGGDMGIVENAAFDPIFYLHHAFIDYIFEQFRKHQESSCYDVDIETDYRPSYDLCRACVDGKTHGHGPNDPMWGYRHLKNIDGLWSNWTTMFYDYEEAPSCPHRCHGKYLYCDKYADPRYPEGLCLTRTINTCTVLFKSAFLTLNEDPLQPQVSSSAGTRILGFQGDGRTRDMTEEESLQILKHQTALSEIPQAGAKQTSEYNNLGLGIGIGVLVGVAFSVVAVVTVVGFNRNLKRNRTRLLGEDQSLLYSART